MKKRILFVVNHAGFFLSHRLPVALAAQRAGYDVIVATPRSRHVPRIAEAGLEWRQIGLSRSGRDPIAELRTIRSLYQLYRLARPDIVHHVTTKPVVYGSIAARAARVRCVVNAVSGLGEAFVDAGRGKRLVRTAVSAAYGAALRHPRMRVIFQNTEQRDQFVRSGWVRACDTTLIPGSGVDMSEFAPRSGPEPIPPLVSLVSRLLWTKGVGDFVDAARRLKSEGVQARFVLVGDPDPDNPSSISREQLEQWHAEGDVEYWGRHEDVRTVLERTSIACLPTYYPEGVPKSLIEAAACALPIVTTDRPGCNAVVRHCENGFLVPARAPAEVARSLRTLIEDPGLRRRFGAAGRVRVERDFSLAAVVGAHLAVYAELLAWDAAAIDQQR